MSNNYIMPIVMASLSAGEQPAAYLDQDYDSVARMGTLACSATGTNTIALTPLTNYPTMTGVGSYQKVGFVPVNSTTGPTNINVGLLGAYNAYQNNGTTRIGNGDLIAGLYYEFVFDSSLNSNVGGWRLVANDLSTAGSTLNQPNIVGVTNGSNAAAGSVGEYINTYTPQNNATITVTVASPAVVTWNGHNLAANSAVYFTNSGGALPTGITANTTYYVVGGTLTGNTFNIATSIANAIAGTAVNTSGSQSGTQSGHGGAFLASTTPKSISAIQLTAGDWDIGGSVGFQATGTITNYLIGGITSSLDSPGSIGVNASVQQFVGSGYGTDFGSTVPNQRVSISGTTTYYLAGQANFGSGNMIAYGNIWARRRR